MFRMDKRVGYVIFFVGGLVGIYYDIVVVDEGSFIERYIFKNYRRIVYSDVMILSLSKRKIKRN